MTPKQESSGTRKDQEEKRDNRGINWARDPRKTWKGKQKEICYPVAYTYKGSIDQHCPQGEPGSVHRPSMGNKKRKWSLSLSPPVPSHNSILERDSAKHSSEQAMVIIIDCGRIEIK